MQVFLSDGLFLLYAFIAGNRNILGKLLQDVFYLLHLGKDVVNMDKRFPVRLLSVLVLGLFLLFSGKSWAAEFEPVSYTAYTSLFWLKEAGVPEAAEYARPCLHYYGRPDDVSDP